MQTPPLGNLSGEAVFKLSVGGSPNGNKIFSGGVATVTLLKTATDGNGSVANLLSDLQAAIDAATFGRAWSDGRAISIEDAVTLARSS